MEPTRRQLPKEAKTVTPPKANTLDGYLFASASAKATRKFLQSNPEPGSTKSSASLRDIAAGAEHLYNYPGDMKLFEGRPAPRGKHAKLGPEPQLDRSTGPKSGGPVSGSKKRGGIERPKRKPR